MAGLLDFLREGRERRGAAKTAESMRKIEARLRGDDDGEEKKRKKKRSAVIIRIYGK